MIDTKENLIKTKQNLLFDYENLIKEAEILALKLKDCREQIENIDNKLDGY